jgi:hypothetical protein
MAITTGQVTVGTTAVQIDGTSNSNFRMHIHNMDNSATLFIGGPDVTTSNGLGLSKLDSLELELYPLDTVWVVSTQAGHLISYLKQV